MDQEQQNMFRCEVVNIFGHLLKEKYCSEQKGYRRGVEYSRIVFRNMQSAGTDGAGVLDGPVIQGKCTACGYGENRRWAHAINLKVVEWLMGQAAILAEIQAMEKAMPCTDKWKDYITNLDQEQNPIKDGNTEGGTLKDRLSDAGKKKIEDAEQKLEGAVTKIIEKVAKDKDDILQQAKEAFHDVQKNADQDATDTTRAETENTKEVPSNGHKDVKKDETKAEKKGDQHAQAPIPSVPAAPTAEAGGAQKPHGAAGSPGRSDQGAGDTTVVSQPGVGAAQGPGPGQPPPPPPPVESPEDEQGPKKPHQEGKCAKGSTVFHETNVGRGLSGSSSSITISFTPRPGTDDDCDQKPKDSGPGDAVAAGSGNDDPPPLNPPKPKPNPNPNQAGSSGHNSHG
ncbi:hypothetical protein AK88_05636 [Plasmodium fragile]|uniref:Schizont-infected cell agglutination extracellular alpha domain-containing protein n=1 Tax=Plasmodium fragile TaxID=5857 RepID=A0A0D9QD34_PLAFR|nr:uncharacterized protein AK88_05636 [Plasmodium fragile]KJP84732.1 hypothetical protein AK88_05636 [Plasmodium fragile]